MLCENILDRLEEQAGNAIELRAYEVTWTKYPDGNVTNKCIMIAQDKADVTQKLVSRYGVIYVLQCCIFYDQILY